MARLNVWLRTESPPKRFNHHNGSMERCNWGNQGSKYSSRANQVDKFGRVTLKEKTQTINAGILKEKEDKLLEQSDNQMNVDQAVTILGPSNGSAQAKVEFKPNPDNQMLVDQIKVLGPHNKAAQIIEGLMPNCRDGHKNKKVKKSVNLKKATRDIKERERVK
ncbi:hypothetical protein QYF36_002742 [Acer negundo]|nr:hypothetical protein QYF36_002742 [Acer negundo]